MQQYDPAKYQGLLKRVVEHLNAKKATLYVKDVFVGADPEFAIPYRFVGEYAAHAMFAHNMFPKDLPGVKDVEERRWTMLNAPSFTCVPERDGCRAEAAIVIDVKNRICLVAGRADYCGVVKKTIFTVGNFLLPLDGRLSMHCSANVGPRGDAAILFGLSGTGKTTLSADPDRRLIGDDETIWSDSGLCNLEDGCYAKLIDLNKEAEPVIAAALSKPGTIIENVPPLEGQEDGRARPAAARPHRQVDHREHALLLSALGQPQRDAEGARARTPRRSCCSPPTPSACCRRSRCSRART